MLSPEITFIGVPTPFLKHKATLRQRAVMLVRKLPSRNLARPCRQVWSQSLQCLNVRQLVGAHGPLDLPRAFGRAPIDGTHVSDLLATIGVGGGGKPIAHSMGLQVDRFSTTATHGAGEMRSVMPRRAISSASSRWLHWLIRRPEPLGCLHAKAMIWHTRSGLSRGCAPGRAASASRSRTLTFASASAGQATQRRRLLRWWVTYRLQGVNCANAGVVPKPLTFAVEPLNVTVGRHEKVIAANAVGAIKARTPRAATAVTSDRRIFVISLLLFGRISARVNTPSPSTAG
jgi:hypothetical protein